MVKDQKRGKEIDERKDMKTSEEIKIYDVGDAPVVDYIKKEKQDVIEYREDPDVIEFSAETIEYMDISTARTVEIDGKRQRDDLKKKVVADFGSLTGTRSAPGRSFEDIERNFDEYKPLCRWCRSSMECQACGGKGKKGLFFKCGECQGTGMCMRCGDRKDMNCPNCRKKISVYATFCRHCGAAFKCPGCYNPLPATATRCIKCRREFSCQQCRNIIAPGLDNKCPSCGTADWFARQKRELPVRNPGNDNK